jgi:hypothetical protein
MSTLIRCKEHTATNGDKGLIDVVEPIPGLDVRVFRYNEAAGGMEYAHKRDFDVMGWKARTYWSLLDPSRFHVAKRTR